MASDRAVRVERAFRNSSRYSGMTLASVHALVEREVKRAVEEEREECCGRVASIALADMLPMEMRARLYAAIRARGRK